MCITGLRSKHTVFPTPHICAFGVNLRKTKIISIHRIRRMVFLVAASCFRWGTTWIFIYIYIYIYIYICVCVCVCVCVCRGRDSTVGIATRYGLDGPEIESRWVGEIFRTRLDRPWGPPSLLYNRYRVFSGSKAAGAWRWPPTPF